MTQLEIALLVVGCLVLGLGLLTRLWQRSIVSQPGIAILVGVMVGPDMLGWLEPRQWGSVDLIMEEVARLTLAIGLMGVALRLPKDYFRHHWRSMIVIFGPVMLVMWLVSGLIVYLLLDSSLWVAMVVGGSITPTDPIVAASIVTGSVAKRNLPAWLRNVISAESGGNDGLAFPLVLLPLLLLEQPAQDALPHWLLHIVVWEVGCAALLAIAVGYGAGRLLSLAHAVGMVHDSSRIGYTMALALAVLGGMSVLGMNGIFGVFVAGVAFDASIGRSQQRNYEIQEVVNRFFVLPIFLLLGAVLPWRAWLDLGWKGALMVALVLLARRPPILLALSPAIPVLHGRRDALFMGWFGPIGVAALYYASLAWGRADQDVIWTVTTLVVCASVFIHGASAPVFTMQYGDSADGRSHQDDT